MPRKTHGLDQLPRRTNGELATRLADELRQNHASGQPVIDEQKFPTGLMRVTVIWDAWDRLSLENRTAIILKAYELAEGRNARDTIALASGLTVPEACAAGMLPYQIIPGLRKGDPVTAEQCRKAMIEEGASTLLGPDKPQLRFATEEEAEAARTRLSERLPNSEPVWIITQDVGTPEDWIQR